MALTHTNPPHAALAVVRAGIDRTTAQRARRDALGGAPRPRQIWKEALPVYTCDLHDIIKRGDVGAARLVGWRYLVIENEAVVETADVSAPSGSGAPTFRGMSRGGVVIPNLEAALHEVERVTETNPNNYELRLLQIPALYIVAFWLYDADGEDLFVRVAPPVPNASPRVLKAREFWLGVVNGTIQDAGLPSDGLESIGEGKSGP